MRKLTLVIMLLLSININAVEYITPKACHLALSKEFIEGKPRNNLTLLINKRLCDKRGVSTMDASLLDPDTLEPLNNDYLSLENFVAVTKSALDMYGVELIHPITLVRAQYIADVFHKFPKKRYIRKGETTSSTYSAPHNLVTIKYEEHGTYELVNNVISSTINPHGIHINGHNDDLWLYKYLRKKDVVALVGRDNDERKWEIENATALECSGESLLKTCYTKK